MPTETVLESNEWGIHLTQVARGLVDPWTASTLADPVPWACQTPVERSATRLRFVADQGCTHAPWPSQAANVVQSASLSGGRQWPTHSMLWSPESNGYERY